jgi:Fungal protein kinase
MPVSQGTWEYMAGDLVFDPTTSHSFVHDLESAFWVLFSQVLRYMPVSWGPTQCTHVLKNIMNPESYKNPSSEQVSGGMSKLIFLTAHLSFTDFMVLPQDLNNHPLTALLLNFKAALAKRYESGKALPIQTFLDKQACEKHRLQSR